MNGAALGGGTEICLAVDLVVADEHAEFGLPEVRRGLVAAGGGVERLPRRIPPIVAMELLLTGRTISALRAQALGLVNEVVPTGECRAAAVALAEEICAAAPLSVRYTKAVARASFTVGEDEAAQSARLARWWTVRSVGCSNWSPLRTDRCSPAPATTGDCGS